MNPLILEISKGVIIPFLGTVLGAACVFFMKGEMKRGVQRALLGFAAGVMVAASVWSLIIPAMNYAEHMEKLAFEIENVKAHTDGKEVVKVVTIPKKLVNIVVK